MKTNTDKYLMFIEKIFYQKKYERLFIALPVLVGSIALLLTEPSKHFYIAGILGLAASICLAIGEQKPKNSTYKTGKGLLYLQFFSFFFLVGLTVPLISLVLFLVCIFITYFLFRLIEK